MSQIEFKYTAPRTVAKFMQSDHFHRVLTGCIGSGKSVGSCVEILRRNLEMPPWNGGVRSSKWAVVRNTMKELRNTTLETWMKWMKDLGEWQESKFTFHLKFGDVDSKILFLPLDGPGDIGRLLSLELTGMFTNECREFPASVLADAKGRLGRYPSMNDLPATLDVSKWYPSPVAGKDPLWYWTGLIGDTNPPEVDSDWYHILEGLPLVAGDENSIVDVEVYRQPSGLSAEAENIENLRPGYYEQLAKGQPKYWVDTYIHGKYSPSQAGKPVYLDTFSLDHHVSQVPLSPDPRLPVIIGFDCGLTPAAVFKQLGFDGRVRVLREAVAFDMGMKRFAETMLRPIINNVFPENQLIFVGDPAGSRRADSDESSAFQMLKVVFSERRPVVKAASSNDPSVRIQATEQALCQFPKGVPLVTIDPSCKWYIEGLRSKYRRAKVKASGEYAPTPEKNDWSHVVEAGQYADLFIFGGRFHPQDYLASQRPHPFMTQPAYRPAQAEGY